MTYDADEILARMRADEESDWPDRLLRRLTAAPLIDEELLMPAGRRNDLGLSPAEARVVNALSHGLSYDQAAVTLGMGLTTVQTHLKVARRKLQAKNTVHLCSIALRQEIIS